MTTEEHEQDGPERQRIVVGVDGSPSSVEALRWALGQARLTGALVDAVAAWEYPVAYGWSVAVPEEDLAAGAAQVLEENVREAAGGEPAVQVRRHVRQGNAAQVLLDAAGDAELLVIGSRGHGGFAQALLGSVGQHCVHHARCPVVIVRHEKDRAEQI